MSYRIATERDNRFQPRKGLEGPFFYADGRVLYYDPKAGQYWDPLTDFYVEQEEMDQIQNYLAKILSK